LHNAVFSDSIRQNNGILPIPNNFKHRDAHKCLNGVAKAGLIRTI